MRITLDLDDHLFEQARHLAAKRGTTLTALMEDALRIMVRRGDSAEQRRRVRLPTSGVPGQGFMPGVDVSDNAGLRELMDEGLPLHKRR